MLSLYYVYTFFGTLYIITVLLTPPTTTASFQFPVPNCTVYTDNSSVYIAKNFIQNNYATKKTVTEGFLDLALLMANAAQLKRLVELGPDYSYYALLMTLVCVSLILQVSTGSHLLLPYEAVRPMKQLIIEHIIPSVLCETRTEAEHKVDQKDSTTKWQHTRGYDIVDFCVTSNVDFFGLNG